MCCNKLWKRQRSNSSQVLWGVHGGVHGGVGVVEIKCPYSARNDANLSAYIKKKTSPLQIVQIGDNESATICYSHEYYYQLQMQMQSTETFFGDLVVWHTEELITVQRDDDFWAREYPKTLSFFYEFLGKILY